MTTTQKNKQQPSIVVPRWFKQFSARPLKLKHGRTRSALLSSGRRVVFLINPGDGSTFVHDVANRLTLGIYFKDHWHMEPKAATEEERAELDEWVFEISKHCARAS
jgi:hypothetical protein